MFAGACENKLVAPLCPDKPSVIDVKFFPTAITKNTATAQPIKTKSNLFGGFKLVSVEEEAMEPYRNVWM